jgi:hypothetical protein
LRLQVGGVIKKARTFELRKKYLTECLYWWRDCLLEKLPYHVDHLHVVKYTQDAMKDGQWDVHVEIKQKKDTGFDGQDHNAWSNVLNIWAKGRFNRRAQKAAGASWTPAARRNRKRQALKRKRKLGKDGKGPNIVNVNQASESTHL